MSDPDDIRGWQRLSERVTTSGVVLDGDIARLRALGVRHVINLALDSHPEALLDEGAKWMAAGIDFTHIPVPFDAPDEHRLDLFRQAMARDPGPVHVHCIMNWRVSAFLYRLNREAGMDADEARALMLAQWDPETNANPHAPAWAAFVARADERCPEACA